MKATFGLGKDWELTEISDQVCYRLDLGNNRFLDIVGHCSGMGDASYDFGHCKMYYICNGISRLLKKDSNLDECMMIGNDIANRKLDDNAIIALCYDEIFKKKEETKRSKDADISIDVDALKKSIEVNGHTSKSIVAMEELAELSQAVSKAYRYIDNNETKMESGLNTADILDNMSEEIADVLICITNLKIMYNIKNEDIKSWIDYKIRRQKIKDTKMKSYGKQKNNRKGDKKNAEGNNNAGDRGSVQGVRSKNR